MLIYCIGTIAYFTIKLSLMTDLSLFSNYLNKPGNIDITWEQLITYKFSKYFSITFSGYLIYDHDIKIPRYQSDGITPIYLTRSNDQLDPITGDNHYFFDYDNPNANNYVVNYVSNDTNGDGLFTDPGEYEGWKIIKTGAATQFMEFLDDRTIIYILKKVRFIIYIV